MSVPAKSFCVFLQGDSVDVSCRVILWVFLQDDSVGVPGW